MKSRSTAARIFVLATIGLALEMTLFRYFSVSLSSSLAYFVLTLASCGFAFGFFMEVIFQNSDEKYERALTSSIIFSILLILIIHLLNFQETRLAVSIFNWTFFLSVIFGLYACLGYMVIANIKLNVKSFRTNYTLDLLGCALGVFLSQTVLSSFDPFLVLKCFTLILFSILLISDLSSSKRLVTFLCALAFSVITLGFFYDDDPMLSGLSHSGTHSLIFSEVVKNLKHEKTLWSSLGRLDVFSSGVNKEVFFDCGILQSTIYKFDGDYVLLKNQLTDRIENEFWSPGVVAPYALAKEKNAAALIIGGGGGQEVKAALLFKFNSIDVADIEKNMLRLSATDYSNFNGEIFNSPQVHSYPFEGRNLLETKTNALYDVIQIFSAQTSSASASGGMALRSSFLMTQDAFVEYLSHLKKDAILEVSFTYFPRVVSTAAAAWKAIGKTDFKKHVLVIDKSDLEDRIASIFISNQPWNKDQVIKVQQLFDASFKTVENPLDTEKNFLPLAVYSGEMTEELKKLDYDISPTNDDRPFFRFIHKSFFEKPRASNGTAKTKRIRNFLKNRNRFGMPSDTNDFFVTGFALVIFINFILLICLMLQAFKAKYFSSLLGELLQPYFMLTGFGFAMMQFSILFIVNRWVGNPASSVTVGFCALFLGSAIGSAFWSQDFMHKISRARFFFALLIVSSLIFLKLFGHQGFINHFLTHSSFEARIIYLSLGVLFLGFFIGGPFAMQIKSAKISEKEISIVYFSNTLAAVAGGFAALVLTIQFGISACFEFGLVAYFFAGFFLKTKEIKDFSPL